MVIQILVALSSNALEVYNVPLSAKSRDNLEPTRAFSLDLPGHRTDVRTLAISSDDQILASASNVNTSSMLHSASDLSKIRIPQVMEHENGGLYPHYGLQLRNLQHVSSW